MIAADHAHSAQGDEAAGKPSVVPPHVLDFPAGIPGFETCRRFVLVASPDLAPLSCLQALDTPEPAFLAIDPRRLDPEYDLTVREFDRARLGATSSDALVWLAIVTVAP